MMGVATPPVAPPASLRILFADDDPEIREYFQEMLGRLGHQAFTVATGKQLVEVARQVHPDLIISDVVMPELDGIDAAAQIGAEQNVPIIIVSAHHDADLLGRIGTDHIMNFLVKPVREADVQAAVVVAMRRFEQYQTLSEEARSLRQALENRKILERAKGAVMRRLGVDEADALGRLKRLASHNNRKLTDVATEVIEAEQIFYRLENL